MARLGRDPQNEVACDPLQDDKVSTFHAQLLLTDNGQLLLSDLGSSNGTFLDGVQVAAPVPISTGAVLSLGGAADGIQVLFTVVSDAPAAPDPSAPGKRPIKLIVGGGVLLLVVLVTAVTIALSSEGDDPGATPSATPGATPSPGATPAASPGATPNQSSPAPTASPSSSPASSPSSSPTSTPTPSATPAAKTLENPWKKFGIGTRFVLKSVTLMKTGDTETKHEMTMTHTLKALSDESATVEVKVKTAQSPTPTVQTIEIKFRQPVGPEPIETRTESLRVPAGGFDDVLYSKYEQVMNGQTTVTESWTHAKLPVGLKTISTGATSTTTSVLIEIERK